jgi:hypothetical protein
LHSLRFTAALRGKDNLESTGFLGDEVGAAVLIAEGVTTDDNGLLPTWDETGDAGNDNGFTEDCTVEDVSNGSVG